MMMMINLMGDSIDNNSIENVVSQLCFQYTNVIITSIRTTIKSTLTNQAHKLLVITYYLKTPHKDANYITKE